MSGQVRDGTAVQKSISITNDRIFAWEHNRGENPLAVRCYDAATGALVPPPGVVANLAITLPTLNRIEIANSGVSPAVLNVFVDWDVPTLIGNSLQGKPGAVTPTFGFVDAGAIPA